ncbi:RAD50-interacting protein 1-like isoform X1 [Asterias rubens]|uniref:RAD50-interacting protein 1-like isoform X1 n=1 Tax=Asterias rubens TaxID=7604 RepID=UPI001455C1AE|nr:RAD50-interacting protein 1-like isoform X1 [Asterias rubens]
MEIDSDTASESTLRREVCCLIDGQIGEDIKSLSKAEELLNGALEERNILEKQLTAVSTETPTRIQGALQEAQQATWKIETLTSSHKQSRRAINSHLNRAELIVDELDKKTEEVQELERCMEYMKWLALVEDLSSEIQGSLLVNSAPFKLFHSSEVQKGISAGAMPSAVTHFAKLTQVIEVLHGSSCTNLVSFVTSTVLFWYKILKEKLASEFEEVLAALNWPFVSSAVPMPPPPAQQAELKERVEILFGQLVKLQLPDSLASEDTSTQEYNHLPGSRPLLLPLYLLLKPLHKRFRYHFHGKKQTNGLDKPEWYLTQVLNWIRDHSDFLENIFQPILDAEHLGHINAKVEFTRGLLNIVASKLQRDIPELLYDEHLLSHTIDEHLMFDRELRNNYNYPQNQPGCLYVLTGKECFERWLVVEKKFAVEKIDSLLGLPTAWLPQYRDLEETDDLKVPECVESFMTLMLVITERYKVLPSPTHHLRFLELQLYLLDDFRVRLLQVMKLELNDPLAGRHSAILNGVNYIMDILKEWSEQVFFLQLQFYSKEQETMESFNSALETLTSNQDVSKMSQVLGETQMDVLEATVFDDILHLYGLLRDDMTATLLRTVINDIKSRGRPYRKDKWFSMPSAKDYITPALSASLCELLQLLKERLLQLRSQLCPSVFNTLWKGIAHDLNKFIYEEVILASQFNEGGAAQLQFDMIRGIFPQFGDFTQRPDNFFKEVKESCILLNLKTGSAILLRELLYQTLHAKQSIDQHSKDPAPQVALKDIGVYRLSPKVAEIILNLRTDWPK